MPHDCRLSLNVSAGSLVDPGTAPGVTEGAPENLAWEAFSPNAHDALMPLIRGLGQGEVFNSSGGTDMAEKAGTTLYRIGGAVALLAGLLPTWMNVAVGIVGEDDPSNLGFFGVVVTAAACAFVARLRASDMARAMLAVAVVQAGLALVIVTAPSTTDEGVMRVLVVSTALALLWLISAMLFHRSAVREQSFAPREGV